MFALSRRDALLALVAITLTSTPTRAQPVMTTPSGLKIIDTQPGTGASPKTGQTCVMHYTGWLYENATKGKKFDSSVDRKEPFEFKIGMHQVIAGWDEGVSTMKVGGKRTLIIPPEPRLRRPRRRRRHSAECHVDLRRRGASAVK